MLFPVKPAPPTRVTHVDAHVLSAHARVSLPVPSLPRVWLSPVAHVHLRLNTGDAVADPAWSRALHTDGGGGERPAAAEGQLDTCNLTLARFNWETRADADDANKRAFTSHHHRTDNLSLDHSSPVTVTVTAVLKCVIPIPDSVHVGSRVLKCCDVRHWSRVSIMNTSNTCVCFASEPTC